jgi:hypothetical protein
MRQRAKRASDCAVMMRWCPLCGGLRCETRFSKANVAGGSINLVQRASYGIFPVSLSLSIDCPTKVVFWVSRDGID